MFGKTESNKVSYFLEVLNELEKSTSDLTPKRVNTSISYLLGRLDSFDGNSVEELVEKLKGTSAKRSRVRTVKTIDADIDGMLQYLSAAVEDAYRFKSVVDQYNKDHKAPVMKELAAKFARASKPKTKAAAVALLVAARNDMERSGRKASEAGRSTPW